MGDEQDKFFLQWSVKPKWTVTYPSQLISSTPGEHSPFDIFGVERGSLDISRNWTKIHSVERFNQGFVAMPEDFTFTIGVKENGKAFEILRRLGKGAIMFDISCDVLRKELVDASTVTIGDVEVEYDVTIDGYNTWMKGYEQYIGCLINREGQSVDIGGVPIREFEIVFLQHAIKSTTAKIDDVALNAADLKEGDGSFNILSELGI